ncbi:UDP-N-acetylglucosamine 1-carboxyvinyltransferase [Candidatus Endolissoclinum faulkneri L5]|uniref:UDP-N-acetylglucosamine 1-carboxyvinyltransferase n=1 Tax=Candidatus Endolissoclinum faulkneri L5 TaxID=1401328 RepID=V9TTD9_9PROT|nr:UDP-N-acetylglucosamine 1-carboxyvinyltransferase [Candidatus Endolissoclinum faulkneri]AHC73427.1 UDP-N-acetylglucosamine 1-carboxyvinyltransferase [Candidatus Endolissoclinum faulkneri L5]
MHQIRVRGGRPLRGIIPISGAKNAALPLMAACLLSCKPVNLSNVPDVADIASMTNLLREHGVRIERDGGDMTMNAAQVESTTAPYDLVRKMRASVLVLGPLVARFGKAQVSLPGGCAIGNRPIDLHLKGLADLGAELSIEDGYIEAKAPKGRLQCGRFTFPFVSVGATENLMMAASLAQGETVLINSAREPEISDLAKLLVAMGAEIEGAGSDTIYIQGKSELGGATHRVVADRIETGTYAMAVAIVGTEVILSNTDLLLINATAKTLRQAGVTLETVEGGVRVSRGDEPVLGVDMMTEPYPGFPTDLQAQFMSLMSVSRGKSMVTETIFDNRFMHVQELSRMGANITVHEASAIIRGVEKLKGAQVIATDLRASVSLVLAGLVAEGETIIDRIYHLDRGYQDLIGKLSACGADVSKIVSG